jgi:hypothetical protein
LSQSAEPAARADGMLVVRFAAEQREEVPSAGESHSAQGVVVGVLATMMFYALLCLH